MATQTRPTPDRRAALRVKVHLACKFIFEGTEYEAYIKNISPMGALLWSAFMPPRAADASIKVETSLVNYPLILGAKIVRRECKLTEQGKVAVFAIKFAHSSPGLILLISKLMSPHIAK
jgi:hypothetical protein